METLLIQIFIFFLGACLGSFANVLIYRIPKAISIFMPGSRCPCCNISIKWRDNIPIISFFLLRTLCRNCKNPISIIYPLVEFLVALAMFVIWSLTGEFITFVIFGFLAFMLIVITFIDLKHSIIPDSLSITILLAGFVISPLNQHLGPDFVIRIIYSFVGIFSGAAIMYLIGFTGEKIFKKESLGGGDIKLMAGAGAFLGWEGVVFSLFIGSFIGTLVSLFLIYALKTKTWGDYIPFGPFLSMGIIFYILFFVR